MEEDIKILEEFKEKGYHMLFVKYGDRNTTNFKLKSAIENLIKGYRELEEKTKKKIEPVLINNKMYFIDKELYEDLLKDTKTNYIQKSKVKENIEKLEKAKQEYEEENTIDEDYYFDINGYDKAIFALQELMEDK